jgi:acetyltransferase
MFSFRPMLPTDRAALPDLVSLLQETVNNGASLGFLAPLGETEALAYWEAVLAKLGPDLAVWIAEEAGRVVGTFQMGRETRANGRHRAQMGKAMVRISSRGQGINAKLMALAEAHARHVGLKLLLLGSEVGTVAAGIVLRDGWTLLGRIPDYAVGPDGRMHALAYFFKQL